MAQATAAVDDGAAVPVVIEGDPGDPGDPERRYVGHLVADRTASDAGAVLDARRFAAAWRVLRRQGYLTVSQMHEAEDAGVAFRHLPRAGVEWEPDGARRGLPT